MSLLKKKEKVCLIGSGNWGSAIAKIVGRNVTKFPEFDNEVRMWVFEEIVKGERLTEIINQTHENVKYLPGIPLPKNIVAVPELLKTVEGATLLIFVVPHQFVKGVCEQLYERLEPGARAISLIKGVDASAEGITLISDIINGSLGIDCSVLMGANIAQGVAMDEFCESTIGYNLKENAEAFVKVFHTPQFRISAVPDVAGVELCGALKNIVAIAAGLVDGLKCGDNTKAAIIRLGLVEMKRFARQFYEGVEESTFFESCGVADLITTCYGGRNRKVAEARVLTGKSFEQLEVELLNGQKLQGAGTAKEVHQILADKHLIHEYPMFTTVYRICYENLNPKAILEEI
ncbi:Glycerol-3-phosphate dehydrogenase [Kappamyces sp. JEL0829]|nr:Glycerol-3-phosphate dehydrogenase [Kappamyces sp. JEL0829]